MAFLGKAHMGLLFVSPSNVACAQTQLSRVGFLLRGMHVRLQWRNVNDVDVYGGCFSQLE